jgi:hypothetical protein
LKCIVCYDVGAESISPRGGSLRLRLPKVKRGLGGEREARLPVLVPSMTYCSQPFKNRDILPISVKN